MLNVSKSCLLPNIGLYLKQIKIMQKAILNHTNVIIGEQAQEEKVLLALGTSNFAIFASDEDEEEDEEMDDDFDDDEDFDDDFEDDEDFEDEDEEDFDDDEGEDDEA